MVATTTLHCEFASLILHFGFWGVVSMYVETLRIIPGRYAGIHIVHTPKYSVSQSSQRSNLDRASIPGWYERATVPLVPKTGPMAGKYIMAVVRDDQGGLFGIGRTNIPKAERAVGLPRRLDANRVVGSIEATNDTRPLECYQAVLTINIQKFGLRSQLLEINC
jgi:hypothetical protein